MNRLLKTGQLAAIFASSLSYSAHAQVVLPEVPGAPSSIESVIQSIINLLLFVVGVTSVIMMIIGGIRYAVSAGDQTAVAAAKNTVLYAIVGLVVAVVGYAVVRFVFEQIVSV